MPKKTFDIGVDLDDTTFQFLEALKQFHSERSGVKVEDLPHPIAWDFSEEWNLELGELDILMRAFAYQRRFAKLEPEPNALRYLHNLHQDGHKIIITTARDIIAGDDYELKRRIHDDTVYSLNYYDIDYDELCFVHNKSKVKMDILFDDSTSQLNTMKLTAWGNKPVCLAKKHNEDYRGLRVPDWASFYGHVTRWANE